MRAFAVMVLLVGCGSAEPVTSFSVGREDSGLGAGGAVTGSGGARAAGGVAAHAGGALSVGGTNPGDSGVFDAGETCRGPWLTGCWRLESVVTPIDCVAKCASLDPSFRFEPFEMAGNTYGGGVWFSSNPNLSISACPDGSGPADVYFSRSGTYDVKTSGKVGDAWYACSCAICN